MACGKALNKQRVLNVGSTKALLLRFSLAAHLPVQDVAKNAQVENFHTKEKALVETKNDSNLVGGGGGGSPKSPPQDPPENSGWVGYMESDPYALDILAWNIILCPRVSFVIK
jgi:hypothetical protein